MLAVGDELWSVGELVHGSEADTERARRPWPVAPSNLTVVPGLLAVKRLNSLLEMACARTSVRARALER